MPAYVDPRTSFFDKAFDESALRDKVLSLQINRSSLDYTVYDPTKNRFTVLESFKFAGIENNDQLATELNSILKEREWLGKKFKQVNLIFSHPASTLIPKALFDEKEKLLFMDFNRPVEEGYTLEYNVLRNTDAVNLFNLHSKIFDKVILTWPDLAVYHSSTVLIESLLINFKNKVRDNTLFVNLHQDYFDVVYLKGGKLFFHNTFQYKSKEDFIYFLLAGIEQLKLNPEDVKVILSGDIDRNSIYYEMVYQYIRNSEFIERNDTFRYSYVLDKLLHHKFYILFNCLQCGS